MEQGRFWLTPLGIHLECLPDSQTYIWRCKDTNKQANYQINLDLFLVSSESIFEINLKDTKYFWNFQILELRNLKKSLLSLMSRDKIQL